MGHAHAVEWQLVRTCHDSGYEDNRLAIVNAFSFPFVLQHSIAHHSYVGGGEWDPDDNWCYGILACFCHMLLSCHLLRQIMGSSDSSAHNSCIAKR